jgi:hypothetical protein
MSPVDVLLEQNDAASSAASVDDVDETPAVQPITVRFPFWVQPADLTLCDVAGCSAAAELEMWEPVDLDTGDELPGRFCNEHQLAWMTRPRETTSTPGDPASP